MSGHLALPYWFVSRMFYYRCSVPKKELGAEVKCTTEATVVDWQTWERKEENNQCF